ncbi:MAG: DUF1311 domain-containing protein [bacterium]|nr:DUF1311 domain-containing protein [bacterium]
MLHLALVFVLAQTQMQLDVSSGAEAKASMTRMSAAYRHAREATGNDPRLARTQQLWMAMRDTTCAYERALVAGGSLEPMVAAECVAALANQRTADLARIPPRSHSAPRLQPTDPAVDKRLNHVYGAIASNLDASERPLLLDSELAWIRYRDAMCALIGGACSTTMERDRTKNLTDSWLGDPVW